MPIKKQIAATLLFSAVLAAGVVNVAHAGAREEGRLLTATEVLEEVQAMPDSGYRILCCPMPTASRSFRTSPRSHSFSAAATATACWSVRDKLNSPWSNPSFVSLTGGSWGLQAGAQSSDIILVFTTQTGIEGIAGGKLTLGADASVATGPVGRQGSAATDMSFNAEIYSYARTRGLFGGIALDGSVISIDRSANAALYSKSGVTATEIFSGSGAGGARNGAALSGSIGSSHAHCGAQLARAAGRRAGLGCADAPRRACRAQRRSSTHLPVGTAEIAYAGVEPALALKRR